MERVGGGGVIIGERLVYGFAPAPIAPIAPAPILVPEVATKRGGCGI